MRIDKLQELRDGNFLNEEQFQQIESIESGKTISVFYELRIILYLGVMLFTTGMGILIYENIGDLGHILAIIALCVLTIICFTYVFKFGSPYSNGQVKAPTPFFDYVILLGCLLFISVLGYLQFQYYIFDESLGATTLVTAAFFFYAAYRFDHLGVLSLAIAALASFWSISISPQKWYSGDFFSTANLHNTALIFGSILSGIAWGLERKSIKPHFTFTFMNFCSLIYLSGAVAGMFMDDDTMGYYLLALYAGCGLCVFFANLKKSFLFLLYAFIFGYIGTTYFLSDTMNDAGFWFFYLLASCGAFVFFMMRYRNYFKRAE